MNKKVFVYWVNQTGQDMPAYIQLCMETWYEHIPDLEVVIINHENLREWTGDRIDTERFKRITLPMQSDVVSLLTLEQHGGIFMDADTIVTRDIFEEIEKVDPKKLVVFGTPGTMAIHVAIQMSLHPHNPFLGAAAEIALQRVNELPLQGPLPINWDHFGNGIFTLVAEDEAAKSALHILNRTASGNILESHYFTDKPPGEQYLQFYFGQHKIKLDEVTEKIRFGAVSLHNSWTPETYKDLTREQVIESGNMLSKLLRYAASGTLRQEGYIVKGESFMRVRMGDKVGRNDPCPCGSGKKYKKCCGA